MKKILLLAIALTLTATASTTTMKLAHYEMLPKLAIGSTYTYAKAMLPSLECTMLDDKGTSACNIIASK